MTRSRAIAAWRDRYSRHRRKLARFQALAFVLIGVLLGRFLWSNPASEADPAATPVSLSPAAETTWTCSMHPQIRQPRQGDCPICGMDLIPVAKTSGGMRTLAVSPAAAALMRIETAPVERRYVTHQIPLVGRVDFDETKLGYITAWVAGRLDRLYVDYTGVEVKEGDHLVYIYSEQLYTVQEELIQAIRNRRARQAASSTLIQPIDLVESAREKLRLLGLKEEQIAEIEKQGRPTDHLTIYAPLGGIVIEKLKQQGERVQLGERIYTIADLSQVWVHLDAYESDLPWLRYGQDVTVTAEAYPGEQFQGRIAFIQPVLNDKTRTVKVRVNVPNPAGKLKPEMFVHAVVRPKVAAGGKVMDVALAGKWISPMHPEIIKDAPGECDICGMPLVRAESLGYVTPATDDQQAPLVIPMQAALVTGTRAVVYVQLPTIPSFAEAAFQTLSPMDRDLKASREAFATFANMLDEPYDQVGTRYARQLWNEFADRLAKLALDGQRSTTKNQAERIHARLEAVMNEVRERFAPADGPTFEGREIVLGSRAGDHYLVRHGLIEGELVVTQGNFKIDAEIQIQAKPSMMTPAGGGGGGQDHGHSMTTSEHDDHAGHMIALPAGFRKQFQSLDSLYDELAQAVQKQDTEAAARGFSQFGQMLESVDTAQLTGHPRIVWKEFAMLLGNDAAEGREADSLAEADRIFLSLKGHLRRAREQMGVMPDDSLPVERIAVPLEFQRQLASLWSSYAVMSRSLAEDSLGDAQAALSSLETALAAVDASSLLEVPSKDAWMKERDNLITLIERLKQTDDIRAFRAEFLPLSQEIGVLAKAFGFGGATSIYEVHCPMAFQGKGATWYQLDDKVLNPYYGATMLRCADRVEELGVH